MSESGHRTTARLDTRSATMGITHRARRVVAYAATVTVIVIEVAVAIESAVFIAIVTASIAVTIVIATRVPVIAVTMDPRRSTSSCTITVNCFILFSAGLYS